MILSDTPTDTEVGEELPLPSTALIEDDPPDRENGGTVKLNVAAKVSSEATTASAN